MGSVSPFLASSSSLHVCILKVGGGFCNEVPEQRAQMWDA